MEEESKSLSDLPENWSLSTIGEITTPVEKIDARTDPNRQITYLDISGIDNQANLIGETKTFRLADAPSRARQIVKSGDVLFSTVRPYLRNIAQVRAEFDGEIASTGFSVLRPAPGVEPIFLFFKAISKVFVDTISGEQYGASYPAVKDAQVRAQPVAVPPTKEQQRIVEKIETLFARLDKGEEAVRDVQKLLTRYRQSVLKSAVTGQLTADWRAKRKGQLEHGRELLDRVLETRRDNWDGRGKYKDPLEPEIGQFSDLPEGWTWASVDQVSSHFGNGLSKKPVLEENEFPILRISAARAMKVSVDDLRYYHPSEGENIDRFWVKTGDLLFTRYNGSARLVGVCGQMREEQSVLHPDKLIKARPIELPDLSTDFLELAWNCGVTRQHIAKNIKTTAGQQGIAGSDIKTAPFPLPSGPEQIEIAKRVWDVFDRTDAMANWCETELKRSASLRQSILKDAFAGKLVPQDPSDEPASTLLARIAAEKPTAKKTRRKTPA